MCHRRVLKKEVRNRGREGESKDERVNDERKEAQKKKENKKERRKRKQETVMKKKMS